MVSESGHLTRLLSNLSGEDRIKLHSRITADKVSLYGVTPIVQRAAAAQATSLVGTASSTDITTGVKAAIIEIMDTLEAIGAWNGAA